MVIMFDSSLPNLPTSSFIAGDHAMFEELPFKAGSVGPVVAGFVVVGVGAVWGSCLHQNKKHGFKGVSSN